jgi:triacylglycerol lipase
MDTIETLAPLEQALQRRGLAATVCSPQPSDGRAPIGDLAAQLAEFVTRRFGSDEEIDYVGFSMGGLIGRVFLQHLAGWRRIRSFVTIATPHRGTCTAYVTRRPAMIQMRPGSEFLADLNRDLSALRAVQFTSVWTPVDLTIVPPTSSLLPVGRAVRVLSPAHAWLPRDPRVQRTVAETLLAAYS